MKRIKPRDSYHQSYLALLRHFTAVSFWNIDSLIVAAHAVYGWMPTILEINPKGDGDVSRAAESLNRAQREFFADQDLENLVRVVNNSLVGASKLLHFTAPDKFAIWDSNVYRSFSGQSPHQYRLRNTSEFKRYHDWLNSVRGDPRS
ncbi:MAG: hypothetical protein HYU99_11240, partial [Deltaproteobacteria bacterium]|nr:hypothetical protein [Deltaproteobacteria bacterium]